MFQCNRYPGFTKTIMTEQLSFIASGMTAEEQSIGHDFFVLAKPIQRLLYALFVGRRQLDADRLLDIAQSVDPVHKLQIYAQELHQSARRGVKRSALNDESFNKFTSETLTWLERCVERHGLVHYFQRHYPERLRHLHRPPIFLFYGGDRELLDQLTLAVVGARDMSPSGEHVLSRLLTPLTSIFCVVSGLAKGIDTAAHRLALKGACGTIAVLGCGLQQCYPASGRQLQEHLLKHHLVISEYPPNWPARPQNFPERNRLVVALSAAVFIPQLRIRSGSMLTAKLAAEQGVPLLVPPANPFDQNFIGNHELLKQGAHLVLSAEDIINVLAHEIPSLTEVIARSSGKQDNPSAVRQSAKNICLANQVLLDSVQNIPEPADVIAARAGQSIEATLAALVELELGGFVATTSNGYVKLEG